MDYFSILNLKQEPFSNSPDPDFFFHSREHLECLQKLELSLLLRRGLNVIIGDVGTGKTTLCRQLIRRFARRDEINTHLVLDPYFVDAYEFLSSVGKMILGPKAKLGSNEWQIKEQIKQYLFERGVKHNKTTVLIIDEGQKIPVFCLEILREFLNYETNEYKLLQIIIFAQKEFENTIKKYANFADRINLYHHLRPLNFRDTRLMVKFRLEKSKDTSKKMDIFSYPALYAIYRHSGGYPRKIIHLCHHCVLAMIVQNRSKVSYALVRSCIKRIFPKEFVRWKGAIAGIGVAALAAALVLAFITPDQLKAVLPEKIMEQLKILHLQPEATSDTHPSEPYSATANPVSPQATPDSVAQADIVDADASGSAPLQPQESVSDESAVEEQTQLAETDKNSSVSTQTEPDAQNESESSEPYARLLGNITLTHNETLSRVIQKVYGRYSSKYFRSLILANPNIVDPDRVEIGQTIYLPAIPVDVPPSKEKIWWILIEESDNLETAYNYLRLYPQQAPAARLIPYWTRQSGIRFAVVLNEYFDDEAVAIQHLSEMPPDILSRGKVTTLGDESTVYFADPFLSSSKVLKSEIETAGKFTKPAY
ncbi:MAG: AAA family ATPase [Desulfobacterales bacterium]|jgi:general secretion pathway protein A